MRSTSRLGVAALALFWAAGCASNQSAGGSASGGSSAVGGSSSASGGARAGSGGNASAGGAGGVSATGGTTTASGSGGVTATGGAGPAGGGGLPGSDPAATETAPPATDTPTAPPARTGPVLVYSRTTLVRHESIPRAVMAVATALRGQGITVETSEDPVWFSKEKLAPLAAVILLSTTGTSLGEPGTTQQAALEEYVKGGGVLIGLHSASSTTYAPDGPLTRLIGGKFVNHPGGVRKGTCHAVGTHAAVSRLPDPYTTEDEIYVMSNVRPDNQVILTCDAFGENKQLPIAWHRNEGQGRVFYTALGHLGTDWAPDAPYFKNHALPGILWALGR